MPKPLRSSITVDGDRFNALSVHLGLNTVHDATGLPQMGVLHCGLNCVVDAHDTGNMPFTLLQKLFHLANIVTRDKIVEVKVEFWSDETQSDALCTYRFKGWLSSWALKNGYGSNHLLRLGLRPVLDGRNITDLEMAN